jgi:hypothetical protein
MVISKVWKNLIPRDLLKNIIKFYNAQDEFYTEPEIVNKNLEYHIPENFIFQALNPYMNQILGTNHEFSTGAYKSSRCPYIIHVDSRAQHDDYTDCVSFDNGTINQNKAVLIPLVEGPEFRTITFHAWSDFNPTRKDIEKLCLDKKNHLLPEDFSHDKLFDVINYLPVNTDYQWHLGDVLVWDRNQWHMSSDFWRFKKEKKFLVLFMA